ncbi:hypothetical protein J8J14_22825, partial [Roseomonas sp. SSH11]
DPLRHPEHLQRPRYARHRRPRLIRAGQEHSRPKSDLRNNAKRKWKRKKAPGSTRPRRETIEGALAGVGAAEYPRSMGASASFDQNPHYTPVGAQAAGVAGISLLAPMLAFAFAEQTTAAVPSAKNIEAGWSGDLAQMRPVGSGGAEMLPLEIAHLDPFVPSPSSFAAASDLLLIPSLPDLFLSHVFVPTDAIRLGNGEHSGTEVRTESRALPQADAGARRQEPNFGGGQVPGLEEPTQSAMDQPGKSPAIDLPTSRSWSAMQPIPVQERPADYLPATPQVTLIAAPPVEEAPRSQVGHAPEDAGRAGVAVGLIVVRVEIDLLDRPHQNEGEHAAGRPPEVLSPVFAVIDGLSGSEHGKAHQNQSEKAAEKGPAVLPPVLAVLEGLPGTEHGKAHQNQSEKAAEKGPAVLPPVLEVLEAPPGIEHGKAHQNQSEKAAEKGPAVLLPVPVALEGLPGIEHGKAHQNQSEKAAEKGPAVLLPVPVALEAPLGIEHGKAHQNKAHQNQSEKAAEKGPAVLPLVLVEVNELPSTEHGKAQQNQGEKAGGAGLSTPGNAYIAAEQVSAKPGNPRADHDHPRLDLDLIFSPNLPAAPAELPRLVPAHTEPEAFGNPHFPHPDWHL